MNFNNSSFKKNILTLMVGTTIAQAIPIIISPILTRIYTPEDFGVFALFFAIVAIFASIANARYELAIVLPTNDDDAINIFVLSSAINFLLSLFLFLIVLFFNEYIILLLNSNEIRVWLYFMPLTIFLIGFFNSLKYFNTRKEFYKDIASSTIIKSISMAVFQLFLGILKNGPMGLVLGQIISQFFANVKLLKNIIVNKELICNVNKKRIYSLAIKYINFPKYSMWAVLANVSSQHLVNILISSLFTLSTLGFYSLVQRVLSFPSSLIGNSIGQVFMKEAIKEKESYGTIIKSFNEVLKKLIFIGIPVFGILFFIVEDLFIFFFGKDWYLAGVYAKILIPFFFVRFISSSMSVVLIVCEKQKTELLISVTLILVSLISLFISNTFEVFLHLFSILMSICYLSFLMYYYKLSRSKN